MLYFDRKRSLTCMKMRARTIRPSTDGSAPGSPVRSLSTQPGSASRIERSSTSRENAAGAVRPGSLPAATLVSGVLVDMAAPQMLSSAVAGARPMSPLRPDGDQLDDLGGAGVLGLDLGGHPAEVERHHAVGDLHDVVHVVGDQHDAAALVGQPAYQVEDLPGLGDAERGGRLVEEDHLAVPQHRLGDGDGLALTTGEVGDQLADRGDGADREAGQRLAGLLLHLAVGEERARTGGSRGRGTCSG